MPWRATTIDEEWLGMYQFFLGPGPLSFTIKYGLELSLAPCPGSRPSIFSKSPNCHFPRAISIFMAVPFFKVNPGGVLPAKHIRK